MRIFAGLGFVLGGAIVAGMTALVLLVSVVLTGATEIPAVPATQASPGSVVGIPAPYLRDFQVAGQRFGVPWSVLAGIYRVECDFGTSRLPGCNPPGTENGSGAQGPGQFLAGTWRHGLAPGQLIPPGPPTASDADGYATDGDGDGVADPWDPADAVASTARLLAANGGSTDITAAIWAYNHSATYVDEVMTLAAHYLQEAVPSPAARGAEAVPSSPVVTVVGFAEAQLGTPYRWGGEGPDGWDCSGLVTAAYGAIGLVLPHNAQAQYDATAGAAVALSRLEPGDLVFFGADTASIQHVGIYVGGGDMIDAPHAGATVRVESIQWPDLLVASRPLAAVAR
jgi:peptidoglycan DL-endopeptidase CwlO